jgi:hypothetical protein
LYDALTRIPSYNSSSPPALIVVVFVEYDEDYNPGSSRIARSTGS